MATFRLTCKGLITYSTVPCNILRNVILFGTGLFLSLINQAPLNEGVWGHEGAAVHILNLGTLQFAPAALTCGKSPQYRLCTRLEGLQSRFEPLWSQGKSVNTTGNEPSDHRVIWSVATLTAYVTEIIG
jgi:hypothetical protein